MYSRIGAGVNRCHGCCHFLPAIQAAGVKEREARDIYIDKHNTSYHCLLCQRSR